MVNGKPGEFQMSKTQDGRRFDNPITVFKDPKAFNISVGVDPVGTWWVYYNKTDETCVREWGSSKVRPPNAPIFKKK